MHHIVHHSDVKLDLRPASSVFSINGPLPTGSPNSVPNLDSNKSIMLPDAGVPSHHDFQEHLVSN